MYCEVYNYLTSFLLGKAAILIHCPFHNRRLLSFLSKTRDSLGRPLYTARLSRIPQLLDSHGPPTKVKYFTHGFRQGHNSARLQASHAQRTKVIGTGQQNYFNPATNDALERFVEEKSGPYGVIDQLSSNVCTWRKIIAILQCKFYHSVWRKQVHRLPNIHIEASLPYISIEPSDSLHFLKDCKKTGELEIVLF